MPITIFSNWRLIPVRNSGSRCRKGTSELELWGKRVFICQPPAVIIWGLLGVEVSGEARESPQATRRLAGVYDNCKTQKDTSGAATVSVSPVPTARMAFPGRPQAEETKWTAFPVGLTLPVYTFKDVCKIHSQKQNYLLDTGHGF